MLVVADARTGIAAAVRLLHASKAWGTAFLDAIERQHDLGDLTRAEYGRLVADSRTRWPHPNDIARDFLVTDRIK